tara:strand:+ start:278 stop:844 length:567 start_codon:yes stop_codon:yes gene_type:complete
MMLNRKKYPPLLIDVMASYINKRTIITFITIFILLTLICVSINRKSYAGANECKYPVENWKRDDVANGCYANKDDDNLVDALCGKKGYMKLVNKSLTPEKCEPKGMWRDCMQEPCSLDCEGDWSDWSECEGECGTQPTQSRTYLWNDMEQEALKQGTTTESGFNGAQCPFKDNEVETRNCGVKKECTK